MDFVNMNLRIKELRKSMKLSQEKFGKLLGITKSGVSDIESGRRRVTEQHIIMLKNHNVNENWIRSGKGEMFVTSNRTLDIAKLTNQLLIDESDSFKNRFINMLSNLTVEEWKFLENIAIKLIDTPTISEETNGQMKYNFYSNEENNNKDEVSKITEKPKNEYDDIPNTSKELEKKYPPA